MANIIGNNAKIGFVTDDRDLRDTIVKVSRQEIWYRSIESVKRQPVITLRSRNFKDIYESTMSSNLCSRSYQVNQPCPESQNCIFK